MGQRVVRVNELLKREISQVLHTRHQAESVHISILAVDVAPNLRSAKVFYATHGDEERRAAAERFFARHHESIRREMGTVVTLKYLPHLDFVYDTGADYGERLNLILDELGLEGELPPGEFSPEP
ncbi:MAG TPA: ribosome-binding factor A [Oceanipulchritudo sp.]|nr:ribosome-binding factor A [Oceanipulchritudo sp.]